LKPGPKRKLLVPPNSIREAYDDARSVFGAVSQAAWSVLNLALQRVASQVDAHVDEGRWRYWGQARWS
jgi:hypothetical protein